MYDSVYSLFKTSYGIIKSTNQTDSHFCIHEQLEKELAQQKHRGATLSDIKYASRLLRSRLNDLQVADNDSTVASNYDHHLGNNC